VNFIQRLVLLVCGLMPSAAFPPGITTLFRVTDFRLPRGSFESVSGAATH
jgi:hypothetical protein